MCRWLSLVGRWTEIDEKGSCCCAVRQWPCWVMTNETRSRQTDEAAHDIETRKRLFCQQPVIRHHLWWWRHSPHNIAAIKPNFWSNQFDVISIESSKLTNFKPKGQKQNKINENTNVLYSTRTFEQVHQLGLDCTSFNHVIQLAIQQSHAKFDRSSSSFSIVFLFGSC